MEFWLILKITENWTLKLIAPKQFPGMKFHIVESSSSNTSFLSLWRNSWFYMIFLVAQMRRTTKKLTKLFASFRSLGTVQYLFAFSGYLKWWTNTPFETHITTFTNSLFEAEIPWMTKGDRLACVFGVCVVIFLNVVIYIPLVTGLWLALLSWKLTWILKIMVWKGLSFPLWRVLVSMVVFLEHI